MNKILIMFANDIVLLPSSPMYDKIRSVTGVNAGDCSLKQQNLM